MSRPEQLGLFDAAPASHVGDLVSIFRDAHFEVKPRTAAPEIQAGFYPFAGINHTIRLRSGRILVRISDILDGAPDSVLRSLALILTARLYRRSTGNAHHDNYRRYILRADIRERARSIHRNRGRKPKAENSTGRHVDLSALFDRLNAQYFAGGIQRPTISWSAKRSKRILGRYDSDHHAIFISRIFDSQKVPASVIDYIMFHEMLHIRHRTRVHDSRLLAHPPEFKAEERKFAHYREAREWLRAL